MNKPKLRSWDEVARLLAKKTGKPTSAHRCRGIASAALRKMRKQFVASGTIAALLLLLTLPARAANWNLAPSPGLQDFFRLSLTTDGLATGLDVFLSSTPTAFLPGPTFPDTFPPTLGKVIGESLVDVTQAVPAGTYVVGDMSFAPGTTTITVSGDYVGTAPSFASVDVPPVTFRIPEPEWLTAAGIIVLAFVWGGRR